MNYPGRKEQKIGEKHVLFFKGRQEYNPAKFNSMLNIWRCVTDKVKLHCSAKYLDVTKTVKGILDTQQTLHISTVVNTSYINIASTLLFKAQSVTNTNTTRLCMDIQCHESDTYFYTSQEFHRRKKSYFVKNECGTLNIYLNKIYE